MLSEALGPRMRTLSRSFQHTTRTLSGSFHIFISCVKRHSFPSETLTSEAGDYVFSQLDGVYTLYIVPKGEKNVFIKNIIIKSHYRKRIFVTNISR